MKVLLVIDSLGSGGAQRQIVTLAEALKDSGFDVVIFYYHPLNFFKQQLEEGFIPLVFCLKRGKIGFNIIFNLFYLLRTNKFNVIISFLDSPNIYSVITKYLSFTKTRNITSERSTTDFTKNGFHLKLLKLIYKRSNFIVFNSFHERTNWINHCKNLKYKSSTIFNGVDLSRFFQRKEYKRTRKFISIGSVSNDKNGLCVIEALNILKNKCVINFTWMGEIIHTLKKRNEYYESMVKQIDKYDLDNVWKWKPPVNNVVNELHGNDALILASVREGMSNVVCEALACGVPVIASNLFDHEILIKDGERGYLFDPNIPESLADSIVKLNNISDFEYDRLSKNARCFAENNLSKERMNRAYIELINNLCRTI